MDENSFFLDRIKKITDPTQQKYLHDVLYDVFKGYTDYSDGKYQELEDRIYSEIPDSFDTGYIYTAAANRDEFSNLNNFWYQVKDFDLGGLAPPLLEIYADCEYGLIKPYIGKTVYADVKTDKGGYSDTALKVGFARVYREAIKRLYGVFSANGRPWMTVNCPFMFKFLDLTDEGGVIPAGEQVTEYKLKDCGLEKYILDKITLLWNVQGYEASLGAPVAFPTERMTLYSHDYKIKYPQSEYMFTGGNLTNFYTVAHSTRENVISLISETQETEDVFVCRIARKEDGYDSFTPRFTPQSNARKMRHADRQAGIGRFYPFTEAELERVCGAYADVGDSLKLAGVSVDENVGDAGDGVDLNRFTETLGFDKFSRRLVLKFDAPDKTDIFLNEKMWFLVSEAQRHINEYKCVGQIV